MSRNAGKSGPGKSGSILRCTACGARNRAPGTVKGRPRCGKCRADLPWIVDAGDDEFRDAIDTDRLVLVDLWAPWCGPCRMVAPVLEEIAGAHAGALKVVKVNVDQSPKVARRYGASSIPMLLLLRNGELVDEIVGAQPRRTLEPRVVAHL